MDKKLTIFLITIFLTVPALSQVATYTVTKAAFSSDRYDEYSPVFYKNGIVFTSNRGSGSLVDYSSSAGNSTFDIKFVDTTRKVTWRNAKLFSKSLSTPFNEGPATFSKSGDTVYFTRNLYVDGKLADLSNPGNKLGIFSAVYENGKWVKIREFRYNSEWYNITTPCLAPDGKRIFFSSDRPGGQGGFDLYYCQLKNGFWEDPANLGPVINTKGNESYPFLNEAGELFFSSDGHGGLGGKDIFVTKPKNGTWYNPVRLDPPVNSSFDDFGIISDPLMDEGYFSSNRDKTFDIYGFKSNFFQFFLSDIQKDNLYCLFVSDTGSVQADTLRFEYVWDFGDESRSKGLSAGHCFPGPGSFKISLDIIDRKTGKLFIRKLTYDIDIFNIEQPFINCPDVAVVSETLEMDGLQSYCPGYTISGYYWEFGDGSVAVGDKVTHQYSKGGEYDVKLGLILKSNLTGKLTRKSVTRKLWVFQEERERSAFLKEKMMSRLGFQAINEISNIKLKSYYSAEGDLIKEALFQVVVLTSKTRLPLTNTAFRRIPAKYTIREYFSPESGTYDYVIDQQMGLMQCYPAFSELISLGFEGTHVRTYVLREPAERELLLIKKNYSMLTDNQFDFSNMLTTSAYIMLDQVVMLLNKYPLAKLEIGVHTDNQGSVAGNQTLSQLRAQVIFNYLINRGVSSNRLKATGYGGSRPINSNAYPTDRRLNRRIEFTIL